MRWAFHVAVLLAMCGLWLAVTMDVGPATSPFVDAPSKPRRVNPSVRSPNACPAEYPVEHGLTNTGRRALVLYVLTSHADRQGRQVEIDNFLFFRQHGILPPDEPTALFSAVDYAIISSNLSRRIASGHGVVECGSEANVRVFETPSGPCDLCAEARLIDALGGAEAVARAYEFVVVMNSGVRGPFFTEATETPRSGGSSPVTWIDHLALAGEPVYTGAIMAGTNGAADWRPYIYSFFLSFPAHLLVALHPVLMAGCNEAPLPDLWREYTWSFDTDLHLVDRLERAKVLAKIDAIVNNMTKLRSVPEGVRSADARRLDAQVTAGADRQFRNAQSSRQLIGRPLKKGVWVPDRKTRCVYRTELQLMKAAVDAQLPPERHTEPSACEHGAPASNASCFFRPKLTAVQRAALSPVVGGYLHDGHYFVRSRHHNTTMVSMGHGAVVLPHSTVHALSTPPCRAVFVKYGGLPWRSSGFNASLVEEVQTISLAQPPRHHAPNHVVLDAALRCVGRSAPTRIAT